MTTILDSEVLSLVNLKYDISKCVMNSDGAVHTSWFPEESKIKWINRCFNKYIINDYVTYEFYTNQCLDKIHNTISHQVIIDYLDITCCKITSDKEYFLIRAYIEKYLNNYYGCALWLLHYLDPHNYDSRMKIWKELLDILVEELCNYESRRS